MTNTGPADRGSSRTNSSNNSKTRFESRRSKPESTRQRGRWTCCRRLFETSSVSSTRELSAAHESGRIALPKSTGSRRGDRCGGPRSTHTGVETTRSRLDAELVCIDRTRLQFGSSGPRREFLVGRNDRSKPACSVRFRRTVEESPTSPTNTSPGVAIARSA